MFSFIWSKGKTKEFPNYSSSYQVSFVLPLLWIEHCMECAAPLCYETCKMFNSRSDGRCVRFENGVLPVKNGDVYPYAQITFRRWAKMQARLNKELVCVSVKRNNRIQKCFNTIGLTFERILKNVIWNRHRPSKVVESLGLIYASTHRFKGETFDGFLLTVYNHEDRVLPLIFEIEKDGELAYKFCMSLDLGWNEQYISILDLPLEKGCKQKVRLYLGNDETGTLTFKYADFVKVSNRVYEKINPAARVKCVAWDLDNTLWDGVIGDIDEGTVTVNEAAISLVKSLDERGILQTIVSKNTYEIAWKKIEELGIGEYFLYPAINWGQKSKNLLAIAKELNINIDTFALIDDSEFERNEVKTALPQVRVYNVAEIEGLLETPEFDIVITEESSKRRLTYLSEKTRKEISASYGDDYEAFLKTCQMELFVSKLEDKTIVRCHELLQRSNQYNVLMQCRSLDYLYKLLQDESYDAYVLRMKDKYGDYGVIGFVSIKKNDDMNVVEDFVMSCRAAKKKVERAFFNWLIGNMPNHARLYVNVVKTDRNMPLRDELGQMPFQKEHETDKEITFVYQKELLTFLNDDIIKVIAG